MRSFLLTVYSCGMFHPLNILLTSYVTIGNHRNSDAIFHLSGKKYYYHQVEEEWSKYQFDGVHVGWLLPLLDGPAMHRDPGCPTVLRSLYQLHRLPAGREGGGRSFLELCGYHPKEGLKQ